MSDPDFLALCMRHQDGMLSPDETETLERELRADGSRRRMFADTQLRSTALRDHFRRGAFQLPAAHSRPVSWIRRPLAALAAGLLIGLFSVSIVWAISTPRATAERLFALRNGSFEEGSLDRGFPRQTGVWSGDEAEILPRSAKEGSQVLGFLRPGADAADPSGRAISCDVFQLVDLRPLRAQLSAQGESLLELSAGFLDARPHNTKPSVSFFCQIYLFSGDPASVQGKWPQVIPEALASGSAQITTLGSSLPQWQPLVAKCLVPETADFAVIQIAARPNLRPAQLDGLFADDVRLTLKTSPALPIRTVRSDP